MPEGKPPKTDAEDGPAQTKDKASAGTPTSTPLAKPGGVEETVLERIDRDSARLGGSTERLVQIQETIKTVEQEVLNKAFDMGSLKAFYTRHVAEVQEHQRLSSKRAALVGQVGALASQLTEARRQYSEQRRAHKEEAARLNGQIGAAKEMMPSILKKIETQKAVQQANVELSQANEQLRDQNAKSLGAVQTVMQALAQSQEELGKRRQKTQELEAEITLQEQHASECQRDATNMDGQLNQTKAAREAMQAKGRQDVAMHWQKAHALLAQNDLLKARLVKAKANMLTIQSQLAVTKDRHTALQAHGESELERMRGELGMLREKLADLENTLTSNVQSRQALEKEIRQLKTQVRELEKKLLAGELSALKAKNTRLKNTFAETHNQQSDSQAMLAEAHANVTRLNSTLTGIRQATARHKAEAQRIARGFLMKVVSTRERAEAARKKAEDMSMMAESVQLSDCASIWDGKHPGILKELSTCTTVDADIESTSAMVASMSSMTKAG